MLIFPKSFFEPFLFPFISPYYLSYILLKPGNIKRYLFGRQWRGDDLDSKQLGIPGEELWCWVR